MSQPAAGPASLSDRDARLATSAARHLSDGVELQAWWQAVARGERPISRFEISGLDRAFGFFGQARVAGRELPVMGNYQELDFDLPKAPPGARAEAAEWLRSQVREFVLRYFLRTSGHEGPRGVPGGVGRGGFLYRQRLLRHRPSGSGSSAAGSSALEVVSGSRARAFVDLRRLGHDLDWVLARLAIRDFGFEVRPFGEAGPRLGMPFRGDSHVVLGAPLVVDRDRPSEHELGRYGLGYAFVRDPEPGLLAYGPGELDPAIELIRFHVFRTGLVRVTMVFVSNRPERLLDLRMTPFGWGSRLFDLASFGLGSLLRRRAARELQREFLDRHALQHQEALAGTLHVWRRVADWLDDGALPSWIPRESPESTPSAARPADSAHSPGTGGSR